MKNIRILSLLFGLISICPVCAEKYVHLYSKTGGVITYAFADEPKVTCYADGLHVSTISVEINFPFSDLQKLTFSDESDPTDVVSITTEKKDDVVRIYSMDGKLVRTITSAENGRVKYSTEGLKRGTYVVKTNSVNFKIIKK